MCSLQLKVKLSSKGVEIPTNSLKKKEEERTHLGIYQLVQLIIVGELFYIKNMCLVF